MLRLPSYKGNTNNNHNEVPVRLAYIQNPTNNTCWRGCGEKGTLLHRWWEWRPAQALWKTAWRALRKLRIDVHSYPTHGNISKGSQVKSSQEKSDLHLCPQQHNPQSQSHGKHPDAHEKKLIKKKKWCLCYMEYYTAIKHESLQFAT